MIRLLVLDFKDSLIYSTSIRLIYGTEQEGENVLDTRGEHVHVTLIT